MPSQENIKHTTPAKVPPPLSIGIFFDGTNNDKDHPESLSNVWYLYDMHGGDPVLVDSNFTSRKFYQRGVGSDSGSSVKAWAVDTAGNAGGYGAEIRFENIIFYIEQFISEYMSEFDVLPTIINLDVFGFSRGAAMARHFVNCIKQDYFDFKNSDINKAFSNHNIHINFLGIYDTVGSFNIAGDNDDFGFSFHIDPSWIVKKAVHIYALNEYRWGFDLQALSQKQDTNYPIDIIEEKFIEIGLPGAHSDIGGSYSFNKFTQFANNSLLACLPLALMVKHARENGVPLVEELSDKERVNKGNAVKNIDNNDDKRSYDEMINSYNAIKPYIENNSLRAPLGLWREHIALADIYQFKITNIKEDFKPKSRFEDYYAERKREKFQSEISYLENQLKQVNTKIILSEQQLKAQFSSESNFNNFKSNYDTLYQKYMHRSHSPFNTTFGMGQQDADDNFWIWKKSVSDERPHRDIFYNSLKDFEKLNIRRKNSSVGSHKGHGSQKQQAAPEFNILESNKWNDPS
jgi:hypothetical protein